MTPTKPMETLMPIQDKWSLGLANLDSSGFIPVSKQRREGDILRLRSGPGPLNTRRGQAPSLRNQRLRPEKRRKKSLSISRKTAINNIDGAGHPNPPLPHFPVPSLNLPETHCRAERKKTGLNPESVILNCFVPPAQSGGSNYKI